MLGEWLLHNKWVKTNDGWEESSDKYVADSTKLTISRSVFLRIENEGLKRHVILQLTGQGWKFNEDGNLFWDYNSGQSYIHPKDVIALQSAGPDFIEHLKQMGWSLSEEGYYQPGHGTTPYLPIYSDDIIKQSYDASEGASIIHLHTRDLTPRPYEIPGTGIIDKCYTQINDIKVKEYDKILPELFSMNQSSLLNVSTSVRGTTQESDSPKRRTHLKL